MNEKTLIILPTLNEIINIKILFKRFKKTNLNLNFLFIDDNSIDGTREYIHFLKKKEKNVNFIFNKRRKGIGRAHRDGLAWAYKKKFAYVITMDSDLAHHPKYILQVLKKKNTAHIILGSRYMKQNSTPGWSKFRIFLSKSAHFFFKIIYKSNLDSTNAFRLYNLKLINSNFLKDLKYDDYEFFFTSIVILKKRGYTIKQIPMIIFGRSHGGSKMLMKHIFKSVSTMFLFYFKSKII
jgi:dolichol-phosphate mannosyltransferase